MRSQSILIVGAGLAGAVHARVLAEAGYTVEVIDKRPHIAGNAFDETGPDGIRIHRYGPHLFHTANYRVVGWIRRFGEWITYTHRVRALLPNGTLAPLPINLDTINAVFGLSLRHAVDARQHLERISIPCANPSNAADYLASKIGIELRDIFFRPYTKKMWSMDLEEMSASVVKRIPLRFDRTDTYFADGEVQLLPVKGYTYFVKNVLEHKNISVYLSTPFEHSMLLNTRYCFASLPIDEFYGISEGPLPYRSIRFHDRSERLSTKGVWGLDKKADFSVLNFTDSSAFTRETAWHRLPFHCVDATGRITITREEPCDYLANNLERYYPIKTADGTNEARYARYKDLALRDVEKIAFIGRCGTYQYLDMDQVINQSLMSSERWLKINS